MFVRELRCPVQVDRGQKSWRSGGPNRSVGVSFVNSERAFCHWCLEVEAFLGHDARRRVFQVDNYAVRDQSPRHRRECATWFRSSKLDFLLIIETTTTTTTGSSCPRGSTARAKNTPAQFTAKGNELCRTTSVAGSSPPLRPRTRSIIALMKMPAYRHGIYSILLVRPAVADNSTFITTTENRIYGRPRQYLTVIFAFPPLYFASRFFRFSRRDAGPSYNSILLPPFFSLSDEARSISVRLSLRRAKKECPVFEVFLEKFGF